MATKYRKLFLERGITSIEINVNCSLPQYVRYFR